MRSMAIMGQPWGNLLVNRFEAANAVGGKPGMMEADVAELWCDHY